MAINEMTYARLWFELLYGKPEATDKCLQIAASDEYSEWHDMYPQFAEQAKADGFENIAVMFEHIADIEQNHEKQFMTLLIEMQKKNRTAADTAAKATPVQKVKKRAIVVHSVVQSLIIVQMYAVLVKPLVLLNL